MTDMITPDDLIGPATAQRIEGGLITQVVVVLEYVDARTGERYLYRAWNTDSQPWTRIGMLETALAEMKSVAADGLRDVDDDDA